VAKLPLSALGSRSPVAMASAAAAAAAQGSSGEEAREERAAPHTLGGEAVDYRIVIPTRGRWRPACEIASERALKEERKPFILVKTLGFLKRHSILPERVALWCADEEEKEHYVAALSTDPYWAATEIHIGVPGIMHQRNHIAHMLPQGAYVVSLDDDVAEVMWKQNPGRTALTPIGPNSFEQLIFHAHGLMLRYKSFIWGLAATRNPMSMWSDGVSTRNGEINGFLYGFINRPDLEDLYPRFEEATEDAERSLRYFKKDKIILRYRMYCAETKCWEFKGGLQDVFGGIGGGGCLKESHLARKEAERRGAAKLHDAFPAQTFPPKEKKTASTLEVAFRSVGGPPVPSTTAAAFKAAAEAEKASGRGTAGPSAKAKAKRDAGAAGNTAGTSSEEAVLGSPTPSHSSRSAAPPASRPALQEEQALQQEESDGEGEEDPLRAEGADENAALEAVLNGGSRGSGAANSAQSREEEQAEMIRKAIEVSMQELVFRINGNINSSSALEEALQESREQEKADLKRKLEEEREEREILAKVKRLSKMELSLPESDSLPSVMEMDEDSQGPPAERFCHSGDISANDANDALGSVGASSSRSAAPVTGSAAAMAPPSAAAPDDASAITSSTGGNGVEALVQMGFDRARAERALKDATGDINTAAAMLLSEP